MGLDCIVSETILFYLSFYRFCKTFFKINAMTIKLGQSEPDSILVRARAGVELSIEQIILLVDLV